MLLSWWVGLATAQQTAGARIYSAGNFSCGRWTADAKKLEHGYVEAWVDGYVSSWSLAGAFVSGGKRLADLGGHPKPATDGHLKTGHHT